VSFLDENTKVVVFGLSRLVCAWVVEVPGGVGAFVKTVVFAFAKSAEGRNGLFIGAIVPYSSGRNRLVS
jgi:hypothetical protein